MWYLLPQRFLFLFQGTTVKILPVVKYTNTNYVLRNWGTNHRVSPWILKSHCEMDLGQDLTFNLASIKHLI